MTPVYKTQFIILPSKAKSLICRLYCFWYCNGLPFFTDYTFQYFLTLNVSSFLTFSLLFYLTFYLFYLFFFICIYYIIYYVYYRMLYIMSIIVYLINYYIYMGRYIWRQRTTCRSSLLLLCGFQEWSSGHYVISPGPLILFLISWIERILDLF